MRNNKIITHNTTVLQVILKTLHYCITCVNVKEYEVSTYIIMLLNLESGLNRMGHGSGRVAFSDIFSWVKWVGSACWWVGSGWV